MSNLYSKRRDVHVKAPTTSPRDQGLIDPKGHKVQHGPAPVAQPVPALFSAARPGVDPMTGEAWK